MTIPLDRFYHYLDHSIDRDVIIYRWAPPGAKNLRELTPLRIYDVNELAQGTVIVAHDQEPLDLEQYHNAVSLITSVQSYNDYWHTNVDIDDWCWHPHQALQSWIYPDLGSNLTDQMVLLHSEPGSIKEQQSRSLGWCTAWIWSNALISQDWFRYAQHDQDLLVPRRPTHTFLIYSRAWTHTREYRLWFLHQLAQQQMGQNNLIRFGTHDQGHHYSEHRFEQSQWRCEPRDFENHFSVTTAPSWASADYDAKDYAQTMIEVILETVIDRVHLTEKTCRALACGQPFVLVSGAGALAFLRSHGFETWHRWIDEGYDAEPDDATRLTMILTEMSRIQRLSTSERWAMYQDMQATVRHNQQRFFSQDLHSQIMQQGIDSIVKAVDSVPRRGQQLQRWRQVPGNCTVPVSG